MDLGLSDCVALVAGSSRGIGQAIAHQLLQEGCRVCITARGSDCLEQSRALFESKFGSSRVMSIACDMTDSNAIGHVLNAIGERWCRLDCVVANVGSGRGKTGWDLAEGDWEQLLAQNLGGSIRLAQAVIPVLRSTGNGSLVFISSIAGLESSAAPLPYSAAKAALISYSKNLSRQVAGEGIRVNCVAPGNILFDGGSWERHLAERRDGVLQMISREVPMNRFGCPQEISDLTVFLCSRRASFITGGCFVADGGQSRSF